MFQTTNQIWMSSDLELRKNKIRNMGMNLSQQLVKNVKNMKLQTFPLIPTVISILRYSLAFYLSYIMRN